MAEPGSTAEKVKQQADIVRIVGDYVRLKKAGQNFMGLCPFHPEKTPSFAVHPVKQIFHCFGCGVGGDVFSFVMEMDKLTFPEALQLVADKSGIRLPERKPRSPQEAKRSHLRTSLVELHETAAQFYREQLTQSKEGKLARAYLNDRGITDEIIETFSLGYAPGGGDALMKKIRGAGYQKDVVEASGLINKDQRGSYYDRFRRRILFPIADERGRVIAFGGRAMGDDNPKYLNSPETPIYTKSRVLYNLHRAKEQIRRLDYTILVEGYMDCIAVYHAGVHNVVASCGTSLTDLHAQLMGRSSKNVVVSFDPDIAGAAATERSLNLLLEQGFRVKVLALEEGLDPDSFIQQEGGEAYREKLKESLDYVDYITGRAVSTFDLGTREGKVAAINYVLPYLARVPNRIERSEWVAPVAQRLGIEDGMLLQELRHAVGSRREKVDARKDLAPSPMKEGERRLLKIFLDNEEFRPDIAHEMAESGAHKGAATERIFEACFTVLSSGETFEVAVIGEKLNEADKRLLYDVAFESEDGGTLEEARACLAALDARGWERRLKQMSKEIEAAAKRKDNKEVARLTQEKMELTRRWQEFRRQYFKDSFGE